MKKSYKKPKMQVIEFECEDVITTSLPDPDVDTEGPIVP